MDYFFLAAYLPTTLKPQRLSIILEKVCLPSFLPSLPSLYHSFPLLQYKSSLADPSSACLQNLSGDLMKSILTAWPMGAFDEITRANHVAVADFALINEMFGNSKGRFLS